MKYELKVLTLGQIIGRAFNIYTNNIIPIFIISIVLSIPVILFQLNFYVPINSSNIFVRYFNNTGLTIISLTMTALTTGLIIEFISKKYLNENTTIKQYIKNTFPRIIPLIGLSLLVSILSAIGYLMLVIPGIIIILGLSLTNQVFIIEKKGIIDSIKRSWHLTKGDRGYIFGVIMILGLLSVPLLFGFIYLLLPIITQTIKTRSLLSLISVVTTNIVSAIIRPFAACGIILIYFNLRIKKEGFELEHLAKHFADDDNPEEV